MALTLEQLRDEIVALPAEDRQTLLLSVQDKEGDAFLTFHPDWKEEIRYRITEYEAGRMNSISLEEFQKKLAGVDDLL